ncbi:MAG: sigma 54-interacting transcriptional regulator [Myxococcaceae bacterium]|nr:sigma 54-interacting transcriptional regulator [Myxococcaceae bacterium]
MLRDASFSMRGAAERKSLFVPVRCEPAMNACWSVNVTEQGMGLVARPTRSAEGPVEGESVELDFVLPAGPRVRVHAVVRWRHDTDSGGAMTSLGVRFDRFEGTGLVDLRRFLAAHRLRVVVAGAPRGLQRALELAFHHELELLFADDPVEVERLLGRGDVATVLLTGEDDYESVALAHLIEAASRAATEALGRPAELKPRVVFAAKAAPDLLVELFNSGGIEQALPPDAPVAQLRSAVLAACRAHEEQLQQQRMSVELERLLRDQARPVLSLAAAGVEGPGFTSAPMRGVIATVRQVAAYKVTVLLQGETGTGKEVLSERVHGLSPRARAPFVVQDCGALPETLLDSELFGHVKGAFTGAVSDHPGLFVLADGGTIFLDEIENTTPNLQAKLLRVIETGDVRAVGGTSIRRVDVRVIAASNRRLADEVAAGRFRADLYYRLNTFVVDVPPLRDRRDDVLPLARSFVDVLNATHGKSARGFTPEAEAALMAWAWPGNVRELRNVVERAVLLSAPVEVMGPQRLPPALAAGPASTAAAAVPASLREQLAAVERQLIGDALSKHGGVVRRAAAELQIDAVTLARRARKLGLEPSSSA